MEFIQKLHAQGKTVVTPDLKAFREAAVKIHNDASLGAVWTFADIANGLMAIPNLISLIVLSGVIVAETRLHLWDNPEME